MSSIFSYSVVSGPSSAGVGPLSAICIADMFVVTTFAYSPSGVDWGRADEAGAAIGGPAADTGVPGALPGFGGEARCCGDSPAPARPAVNATQLVHTLIMNTIGTLHNPCKQPSDSLYSHTVNLDIFRY